MNKEILARVGAVIVAVGIGLTSCGSGDPNQGEVRVRPAPATIATTVTTAATVVTLSSTTGEVGSSTPPADEVRVRVGAGVLADDGFTALAGRRVGFITNNAARVDGERVLDLMIRSEVVDLVAVFAPEHGIEANDPAGSELGDTTTQGGEIIIHSLYGPNRAPTQESLADLDVLVFDLQDVGVRAYTYLSTMGLAMVAAAEAEIPFVVLDRPNPLGGDYLAGYVRDPDLDSFISAYPVPAAHGLTAGELALAIKGEGWLDGVDRLQLEVVAMEGWHRDLLWSQTDLAWLAPSPGLPTVDATSVYPGTVLFEATSLSVGRGTEEPFTLIGAPWVDGERLAAELNSRAIPGVWIEAVNFTPIATPLVPDPQYDRQALGGIRIVVTDRAALQPVELGIHLFEAVKAQVGPDALDTRSEMLDLLAGSDRVRHGFDAGVDAEAIIAGWADEVSAFAVLRQPYLLYD